MPVADEARITAGESRMPPAKESTRIAGMFDAIASRYDFLNHLLSAGLDKQWRKRAVAALQLTGRETVLDLCTGTADLALAATGSPQGARRVVGIDFSPAMLEIGKRKIRAGDGVGPSTSAIDLVRGDAMCIPLGDATVHAVTIGFGIRNVEDVGQACREIVRVLRPGGRLVILEFSLPRSRVLRKFYLSYFRRVLPRIGKFVSKHPSAYTYLPQSVEAFPPPARFLELLRAFGFGTVRAVQLTFGVVYLFVAEKEGRDLNRML
jgi:demethylmenaquinone methyltransferase / 2-methoxy-6-polyprenyl-1,4-benzoquinol methylase